MLLRLILSILIIVIAFMLLGASFLFCSVAIPVVVISVVVFGRGKLEITKNGQTIYESIKRD